MEQDHMHDVTTGIWGVADICWEKMVWVNVKQEFA